MVSIIVDSLNQIISRNRFSEIIFAFVMFVVLFFLIRFALKIVLFFLTKSKISKKEKNTKEKSHSKKSLESTIDYEIKKLRKEKIKEISVSVIKGVTWPFYAFISFYLAMFFLDLPQNVSEGLNFLLVIFLMIFTTYCISKIISYLFKKYVEKRKKEEASSNESMIKVLNTISNIFVWTLALLIILSYIGIEITPLIAGLGIGGIAIAFALQGILSDLFAAFVIYFDKPFEEGDFIIVGNDMGVIKYVGIKSTRIQALGGQELVISNKDLTSSRINNYKKMKLRRIVFSFGVEHKTKVNQLKKIKGIVANIINQEKKTKLDRVHFKEFAESSLVFEVVYYIDTNDYKTYMDIQEKINLKIKESLEKEKIRLAFPSRSIYMN